MPVEDETYTHTGGDWADALPTPESIQRIATFMSRGTRGALRAALDFGNAAPDGITFYELSPAGSHRARRESRLGEGSTLSEGRREANRIIGDCVMGWNPYLRGSKYNKDHEADFIGNRKHLSAMIAKIAGNDDHYKIFINYFVDGITGKEDSPSGLHDLASVMLHPDPIVAVTAALKTVNAIRAQNLLEPFDIPDLYAAEEARPEEGEDSEEVIFIRRDEVINSWATTTGWKLETRCQLPSYYPALGKLVRVEGFMEELTCVQEQVFSSGSSLERFLWLERFDGRGHP